MYFWLDTEDRTILRRVWIFITQAPHNLEIDRNVKRKQQESSPAWTQEAYRPPCSHSNFLLFWGGGVPWQKFFSQSEHVSSQIWCQKVFPLLKPGTPPPPKIWDLVPPQNLRPGTPPKIWDLVPPPKIWDLVPPPPGVDWHTKWKYNLPSSFGCGR